jgi:hypothetical protein
MTIIRRPAVLLALALVALSLQRTHAQVFINEIMYHPVEEPAFNADGSPLLDLYTDVHEFVELHNPGADPVSLAGWQLAGGIRYSFPATAIIEPAGFVVIAKSPARLLAVPEYNLAGITLLGPFEGQLGNRSDTVRLRDGSGQVVDSVSYSAEFPWAISADALGADEEWTGLRMEDYQYRGRSLERVSLTHPANDPANWLASPLPGNPSPGRPNAVRRSVPRPVVLQFSVAQDSDEAPLIRANQPARLHCGFSSTDGLSNVRVEWFVDDIDRTDETRQTVLMSADGPPSGGRYTAVLPGQPNRSIIRFRFLADRGAGIETVSPRHDDPYEWHAYFVTPLRTSTRPVYDCFISARSLSILGSNIAQSPRRITTPDPPGKPRLSWNATEPAVMVHNGVVYDIQMRHHGSRYNRRVERYSLKWKFPRYNKFNGVSGIFQTDKGDDFVVGHGLFQAIGLPVSDVRYTSLYLNDRPMMQRLEQGEFNRAMLEEYHRRQQALNPGSELEPTGEIYKNVGTIDMGGEGPYGRGDGRKLSKAPHWTDLQMYEWTFSLQNHGWRGSYYWKQMIDAFWAARGDTPARPDPNIPALRAFFNEHFDIDAMLTFMVVGNWSCPWDDTTQNHFFWQRRNGKWCMLPWDNDAWFGRGDNTPATASIFMGEVGDRSNNYRGPNFFKDAFIKAFRQELKERFFLLNNTFLHPDNLVAMGFGSIRSFATARMASVNQQCGLGVFQRPGKPSNLHPNGGVTALPPGTLRASAYDHSATPASAHARTTWEIRTADGSYLAPLWKVTSATDLTSIPIPFEALRFGERYFWRCTYHDSDGHPSLISDEAYFNFGPSSAQTALIAIDSATQWRYDQSGTDRSASNWTALNYDDSNWQLGAALLARENSALSEPIRTELTLGRTTYYFRKRFHFPGQPQGAIVQLRYMVDDGCVIYINAKELVRVRMPDGPVTYNTLASQNVDNAVVEGPIEVPASLLVSGENIIAVEVHQSNANSSDIVFGLSIDATLAAASGVVVLNEIAARNTRSVQNAGEFPDWIELYNNGSQAIDLGGYSLSDDVLAPGKYIFPAGTLIPARGYLTVWCDRNSDAPGLHTGFALSERGQTVALFSPADGGWNVNDYVTFGLQLADLTVARAADGGGDWQLAVPTPGAPNRPQPLAAASNLRINEWMASPHSGEDWVELFNSADLPVALGGLFLTDDFNRTDRTQLAQLSFIGPRDFKLFIADEQIEMGADHLGFKLSAAGEVIGLFLPNGTTAIDTVSFGPQTAGVSQGRLPDGGEELVFFAETASPGDSNHLPLRNVVISEVLAHTDPPLEDAIELQNLGASIADLSGWWLSDSSRNPQMFQIPAGTVIQPGGFAVFYEHQFNNPGLQAPFALNSARGDQVVLSEADQNGNLTGYRSRVVFGATEKGVSLGRLRTSLGHDFTALAHRTFGVDDPATVEEFRRGTGQSNSVARVGPVVISEIMYRPPNSGGYDVRRDEFIELHNPGDRPVPLFDPANPSNTWVLRDAVEFEFPPGVSLAPGGTLVVVGFNPAADLADRAGFEAAFGPAAALYGPFSGRLDNAGETVQLYQPDAPQNLAGPEPGFVPYILVDRVEYSPDFPWPSSANGEGASLTRIDNRAYGNEPQNWRGAPPSPGRVDGQSQPSWSLTIAAGPAGAITIRASGAPDAQVILQASSDLAGWTDLATSPSRAGSFEFTDPDFASRPARYYRVVLAP